MAEGRLVLVKPRRQVTNDQNLRRNGEDQSTLEVVTRGRGTVPQSELRSKGAMTYKLSITPESVAEVEYFGVTTYADRAQALDELGALTVLPSPRRFLVNFLGATVVTGDDPGRLDFISKAITHPVLEHSRVALVGVSHADAHPAETAGIIRLIKVRSFERREQAMAWLLDG